MSLPSELPVVQAPMAGGPSTPALTAAVAEAGGYGFVAAGYLSEDELHLAITTTWRLTGAPFGVNLFVPSEPGDLGEVAAYGSTLQAEADRLGVALGEPHWEDDGYSAKLHVVESTGVHMVSFTFGCPSSETVDRMHRAGIQVAVTVTSVFEAQLAAGVGADLLAVQGTEAGGHQGGFADLAANHRPLLSVLPEIRDTIELPMIGCGGIMTGRDAGGNPAGRCDRSPGGHGVALCAGGGDVPTVPGSPAEQALPRNDPYARLQRSLRSRAGQPVCTGA